MLRPEIIHQLDPGKLILQGLRRRPGVRGNEQCPGVRRHLIPRPERELGTAVRFRRQIGRRVVGQIKYHQAGKANNARPPAGWPVRSTRVLSSCAAKSGQPCTRCDMSSLFSDPIFAADIECPRSEGQHGRDSQRKDESGANPPAPARSALDQFPPEFHGEYNAGHQRRHRPVGMAGTVQAEKKEQTINRQKLAQ